MLLKLASALLGFMVIKAILPISVILFYFKWPLIQPETFSGYILGGLIIILTGLFLFRYTTVLKERSPPEKQTCFSFYLRFKEPEGVPPLHLQASK
jgi:hypothetical protein